MKHLFSNAIIPDAKSYWALHFCAVLDCLHQHKQLQFKPTGLPRYPAWTLSDMRGNMPANFFLILKGSIKNWGFQYFVANYLNIRMGEEVVRKLIDRLAAHYSKKFFAPINRVWFHVSGIDSKLGALLEDEFSEVYPKYVNGELADPRLLRRRSDLCMTISPEGERSIYAIFGEVEGNNGDELFRKSFWDRKPTHCVYGVGIVEGSGGYYIEDFLHAKNPKINILFESKNHVVIDFNRAVEIFESLFLAGPNVPYSIGAPVDDGTAFFRDWLVKNWNVPVNELIPFLRSMFDSRDYVGRVKNIIPYMPSIQL